MNEQEHNPFEEFITRDMNVVEELRQGQIEAAKRDANMMVLCDLARVAVMGLIIGGVILVEKKFS
jgi:hypothetical protein